MAISKVLLPLTAALVLAIAAAAAHAGSGLAPNAPCNDPTYNLLGNGANSSTCPTTLGASTVKPAWVFGNSAGVALQVTQKSDFVGGATFHNGIVVSGRSTFSRSGVLTAPGGTSSVQKTGVSLGASSYVLATIQRNAPGVWVRAAVPDPGASTITIYFNTNAPAGTNVAWFVVN